MDTIPGILRPNPPASVDYNKLIRLLDAEMLESVGQPVPMDDLEFEEVDEAPDVRSVTRRFLPLASVGLVASAVSVLILAHFSGM